MSRPNHYTYMVNDTVILLPKKLPSIEAAKIPLGKVSTCITQWLNPKECPKNKMHTNNLLMSTDHSHNEHRATNSVLPYDNSQIKSKIYLINQNTFHKRKHISFGNSIHRP